MISPFIVLGLLSCLVQGGVIIQSDGVGETLEGPEVVTISSHNYGSLLSMPYPGAKVIWGPNWNNEHGGVTKVFSETFKLVCKEPVTIYVAADNAFQLFINGWEILSGNNINKVYQVEVPMSKLKFCDKNELVIKGTNSDDYSKAGVIYQVTSPQDCIKC